MINDRVRDEFKLHSKCFITFDNSKLLYNYKDETQCFRAFGLMMSISAGVMPPDMYQYRY